MRSPLEQAQGDSQIVGGADQLGRPTRPGLPAPHELLTTGEVGALLFPKVKYPTQAVWRWLNRYDVPTKMVGGRLRVLGESVLAELSGRDRQRRRVNSERQRSKIRSVAS